MLDRVLRFIVTLTLLLFLLQAVIGVLARGLEAALHSVRSTLGTVGGVLGQVIAAVAIFSFLIGLLVRGVQLIASRDPRGARERATRDRATRQRVRRPAEGVPPLNHRGPQLRDPDPALNDVPEHD